ncbi:uncharacterized protein LOC127860229 [Dreissena polymorpha]|uniref:uncharacterized protein LOC127860229 n=1 Tax=Dreissena polymorpha TaxID=45954 RepID=UPI0022655AD6|nr:uncharacterized protein LOC127860229 [Dreissena polymorpha]
MLEKKTLNEMKDTLTKLQASLKSDVDKCATLRDELKQLGDAIQDIRDKGKQELSLIAKIKCHDKILQFERYEKKNFVQVKSLINFQPNTDIVQYLSKLSSLGKTLIVRENPDQIIRIDGRSEYDVHMKDDKLQCRIRDMYVFPNGQVLVADNNNNNIKLLNQQYKVVSHCRVSCMSEGMCQITPTEVCVTVGSDVQFIEVNISKLVTDRKLQLQHDCTGVSYHQGDLFVASGTALYKYTLKGKLVSKVNENKADHHTVYGCAVSPTGDRLYITNPFQNKLITLATDGSLLATFMDPE